MTMRILKPKIINKDGSGNTRRNKAGELSTINHMCLIDLDHLLRLLTCAKLSNSEKKLLLSMLDPKIERRIAKLLIDDNRIYDYYKQCIN